MPSCNRWLGRCLGECGACLEPAAPCLVGWMTCCDPRVVWRARKTVGEYGRPQIALTIDDIAASPTTLARVKGLVERMKTRNVKATFFVIFAARPDRETRESTMVECILKNGHEIGLHFAGRCFGESVRTLERDAREAMQRMEDYGQRLRYVRMPGGFSRWDQVSCLNRLGLTVVNGTAYPFDADLCAGLDRTALGICAAQMGAAGGRIAILHDGDELLGKVTAFAERAAQHRNLDVITLGDLLGQNAWPDSTPCLLEVSQGARPQLLLRM